MASNPPAQCCTVGVKHEGEPTGTTIKVGQYDAYVAEPKGKKHEGAALLYVPDVFGIWQNSQLMADQFAANGYYTIIVDIFNGDALSLERPKDFDLKKWLTQGSDGKNPHTKEAVDPIVELSLKYLKEQGFTKVGAVGYCFGAKYVVRHYKDGIKVGYVAHPSFVDEDELAAITGPLSIAAAETDEIFPTEKRHKSEEILAKVGQPYQINLYSGVVHGFSVRCDTSKKIERWSKEQAFLQAVAWFDEHLL
ncbi:alpha/beta-hydrolase [Cryphonectria parasitica EP155]|uniref:Alpha/beta-hydrolase n=1 Tax=Cryphonectria parasitica (strain ATCC 38755 / EP155) TaxID=660469 RepID=A0A9P4XW57_CRYP1|nr:alpha/beta-hydrolase [Cryphonectria parasitica EP155]KAF3761922.1 alpha/beta-hydrolase [Cryphonectria parasitica EP155]